MLFKIRKKKIVSESDTLRAMLQKKAEKARAAQSTIQPICNDLVHLQVNNHTESCFVDKEVFFGKRLAAAFEGLTAAELFKPTHPLERRNRANRNKLTTAEEETLHKTRLAIRNVR